MTDQIIDVERRLELAASELLKAYTLLTALVTAEGVFIRNDTTHKVAYPCATIYAMVFAEFGENTGWYKGALQLAAMTYRLDDKDRAILKKVLGACRAFSQQPDLATQFNETVVAVTAATALDVRDATIEGPTFDASEDKVQSDVLTIAVLCRPTQAVTI